MAISINESEVLDSSLSFLNQTSNGIVQKANELFSTYIPPTFINKVILCFIAVLCIYFGSKVTQKIAKVLLIMIGIILIISVVVSFIMG